MNMNSKNITTILLTFAALLFLALSLYFLNENMRMSNNKAFLYRLIAKLNIKETSFDFNKKMTGKTAPDVLCITPNGNEKYFSELLNEKPMLIYRYSLGDGGACTPCYEEQIHLLKEYFQETPQLVSVLASYRNQRDFIMIKRGVDLGVPIYHVPSDAFDWALEEISIPYYFVLYPNMKISNIYVPNEHEPELNRQYLESIKRLLL
jgi:hypothetical protein